MFLICQRHSSDRHSLKWEFPGGKVEPGETHAGALARELEEELSIRAMVGRELTRHRHQYQGRRPFLLVFLRVDGFSGEPHNNIFADVRWVKREDLTGYDFLAGDRDFVQALAAGAY
jgi:8-oxo-dGTP diphosphatase